MKVLLKVSGSISVYKICELVSKLTKEKHEVRVAASRSSLEFVGASTWEGLSGAPVFIDDFSPNRRMDHIYLNDWADVVVLAPASAQTINSLVCGVGASVLTTLFLARKKETPYLVFPAMNPRMWTSESVQKSIKTLITFENIKVFSPSEGRMACGHTGVGRLNEIDQVLDEICKVDNKESKALVTFGGTKEEIDGVRSIGNFSTGRTGAEICRSLRREYEVTALGSVEALSGTSDFWGIERLSFRSSDQLSSLLFEKISKEKFDLIVHAAAVSDFLPELKSMKKIPSDGNFEINWKKAPKVLEQLREVSKNKDVKIVSFKLTHNQSPEEVSAKILRQLTGVSDFLIHNELSEIEKDKHAHSIWKKGEKFPYKKGNTKTEMVESILEIGRV